MTDTGGLFYAQTFRQTNKESIKSTGSHKISKIRATNAFSYTYPTQSMKHAHSAILSYLRHIYQKAGSGISNFKTNTRPRNNAAP